MTDLQDLRAIVAAWWEDTFVNDYVIDRQGNYRNAEDCIEEILIRARAALAEPEPEGPTRRQLMMLADDMGMTTVGAVTPAEYARAARRPKPPSQAEQAIAELDKAVMRGDCITTTDAMPSLRAALKRLAELEAAQ